MVLPILALVAAGYTASFLASEVASGVQNIKEKPADRQLISRPQVQRSFQAASQAVDTANPNDLIYQASGFIPGIGALDRRRQETFVYAAQADLIQQGYTNKEALRIANIAYRDYAARGISEIPVALATEGTSELIGRRALTKYLPKAISQQAARGWLNPVARAGIKSSAIAGAYEGSATIITEDVARRRFGQKDETVLPLGLKKGSIEARTAAQAERIAGGAGFGAAFAGGFGLVIAGQRIPRKRVSQAAEVIGYSIDPGEFPGDKIADVVARRYREPGVPSINLLGGPVVVPRAKGTRRFGAGLASFFTGTPQQGKGFVSEKAQQQLNKIQQQNNARQNNTRTFSFVSENAQRQLNEIDRTGRGKGSSTVPGVTDVPNIGDPIVNVGEPSAQTQQDQEQTANSFANVPTDVNIPATSTLYRGGSPPLPFLPTDEEESRGRGGPRSQRYVNELRRGGRLLRRLL